MSLDEQYLLTRFVDHFIKQCAQLGVFCSHDMVQLFDDVSTSTKLQKAVSEIVRWRLNSSLHDLWHVVHFAENYVSFFFHCTLSLIARSCVYWTTELAKIDKRLWLYFSAVALLHVARKISINGFSDKPKDILSKILHCNFNRCYDVLSRCKTIQKNTLKLVELLQKPATEHLTTYRQLLAQDLDSVATIVTVDVV